MSTPPKDLFKRYATPPTPLHDAVQRWARKEGWIPPWDHEEQQKEEQVGRRRRAPKAPVCAASEPKYVN